MIPSLTRKLRIAILGGSPCGQCSANCCKQNGHEFAVLLRGDEVRKFAAFSIDVPIDQAGQIVTERVLPYINGRCQFLDADDRCTIYQDRPQSCREFECVTFYNQHGVGAHGRFLELNADVKSRLEAL